MHGGEQDELATNRVNTKTKYPHRHTTGEGYQGGAYNQRGRRNQTSRGGWGSETRGEVNTQDKTGTKL